MSDRVNPDPLDLASAHWGNGDRRVLLLHGLGSAGRVWWRIGEGVAARGIAAWAPDLRGHGRSAHPGDYRIDAYATDVIASCPGPWDLVVGHSLGGAVAVAAAARATDFARGLLLVDPAIEIPSPTQAEVAERLAAEAEHPSSLEELLDQNPRWSAEDASQKRAAVLATSPEVMRRSIEDNMPWQLGDDLAGLDVPVHVLGADPDHDALFGVELFDRLRSEQPELSFEVVPGAGHSIFRDDPNRVLDVVLNMLDRIAPTSAGDGAGHV